MGTPDMRGAFGTFTYFTDDPMAVAHEVPGGHHRARDGGQQQQVSLVVGGPENTLRKDHARSMVTISVHRDPDHPAALFEVDGQKIRSSRRRVVGMIQVRFPYSRHQDRRGNVPDLAKKINPEFEIYVSPVKLIRCRQPCPSRRRPRSVGNWQGDWTVYTQGIPEDTAAWRSGVLNREEFEQQTSFVSNDELRMFNYELSHFKRGILYLHYSVTDPNSHMLWGKYDADVLKTYQRLDAEVGYVMRKAPGATLIVMSDHGFESFKRAVNLNTWLYKEGFLALNNPADLGKEDGTLTHVDWAHTQAYAIGLNSLYLNLAGREKYGIVPPAMKDQVAEKIVARLEALKDPLNGSQVVYKVYRSDQVYHGSATHLAPDMIVGWERGYRTSWETALGEIPTTLIEDNDDQWRADHCIAPELVPAVFLSNRKIKIDHPWLGDVTVTLLHAFGVPPARACAGIPYFERGQRWQEHRSS